MKKLLKITPLRAMVMGSLLLACESARGQDSSSPCACFVVLEDGVVYSCTHQNSSYNRSGTTPKSSNCEIECNYRAYKNNSKYQCVNAATACAQLAKFGKDCSFEGESTPPVSGLSTEQITNFNNSVTNGEGGTLDALDITPVEI